MRGVVFRFLVFHFIVSALASPASLHSQQDSFRWMDFHNAKDQDVVVWVTRALEAEKWSSIREIGVLYDAALVVTTLRTNPQASPSSDTFNLWSVSLTTHALTPLLKGVNLRWLDWMQFSETRPAGTGRALRGLRRMRRHHLLHRASTTTGRSTSGMPAGSAAAQAVPILSAAPPEGVTLTRVYAILSGPEWAPTGRHMEPLRLRQGQAGRGLRLSATISTPSAGSNGPSFSPEKKPMR